MKRLGLTLAAFVVWAAITILVGRMQAGGEAALLDGVSHGIGWAWVLAAGFILAVVLWQGWQDVGLDRGAGPRTWRLIWLPMLYILGALAISISSGFPPASVAGFILINCLLVGFSEELMFRGAILQALRHLVPIWPAILLTSLAFGAIHSLNVFVTGELTVALIQSTAAFLSGLVFIGLRLRTGSLWPPVLVHGLWDFATFAMDYALSTSAATQTAEAATVASPTGISAFMPALIVLPNALYGLWLLRHVGKTHSNPNA